MSFWHDLFPEFISHDESHGTPAIMPATRLPDERPIHVCFDWDSTLAISHSERIVETLGYDAFVEHEILNIDKPHEEGPLLPLFRKLYGDPDFRLSIVTARSGRTAGRVMTTLNHWNLLSDGIFCCDGSDKGLLTRAIGGHILFDDHSKNIDDARRCGIPAAIVRVSY